MIPCEFCDQKVDTSRYGVFSQHTCWARNRGSEGGMNAMTLLSDPLAWAHRDCIDSEERRRGRHAAKPPDSVPCHYCTEPVSPGQTNVFSRHIAWGATRRRGGANALALVSAPLGWAHPECIDKTKRHGEVVWESDTLF